MDETEKINLDLFKDLKVLSAASFPKRCAMCGQTYASAEEFLQKTESIVGHSGIKQSLDDDDKDIVQVFRNCACGSTLMDCFSNRRDVSETGLKRRALFDKLMDMLVAKGLAADVARMELLALMRGEKSVVLEKMGIKTQIR